MTGRRGVRVLLGAVAAGLTVLLGVLVVPRDDDGGGTAPPRPRQLRVVHHNLCGAAAVCPWNSGGTGPGTSIPRLVERAARLRADIVTVNEICLTQYAELKRQLVAVGWQMDGTYASSQGNVPVCGGTGAFGSAVLSREDVPDDRQDYHRFTDTGGETYTGAGRTVEVRRGLLCAHTSFAGRPLVACTAHTNAKAPGQLREIRDRLARLPQDMPVILAGDLNLPPDAPALAHLTGRFAEADEADGEPTADGRKIDYVFADRRHFTAVDGDAEKYTESDHALLTGRFTLTSAST
ncbi:endonuclease/exonuclease/phosphatase family protein [Streptomyces brasiliscabiei]|uniref:Endonuclease/exonuclease/phosphatase family protein n=1 Tax=Streptomyces brasiliscabiei TaxID=2736302 RepID=A0ABU8G4S1_9ACTN